MGFVPCQPGLWALQDLYTRCFLAVGKEKALLLDSGIGDLDVRALAAGVTALPIVYVNSHAHCDHIGRSLDFISDAWAHPAEFPALEKSLGNQIRFRSAQDGHMFELGGLRLRAMHLPGHTPGSVALLEDGGRYLLSADQVSSEFAFLTGAFSIADYRESLRRLLSEQTAACPSLWTPDGGAEKRAHTERLRFVHINNYHTRPQTVKELRLMLALRRKGGA